MPVNTNIPMSTYQADTATPINNLAQQELQNQDQQNQNAMATEQILRAHYEALDAREKNRLSSTIIGASQLKSFLDNNDTEGAKNFLSRRKAMLRERMAYGENIDTQETDYALEALNSGKIDELKNEINGLMAAGQVYGIVDPAAGMGGETGVLVNRLIREGSAKNVQDALQQIKGGAGQTGRNEADISSGRKANYETQTGKNISDLEYSPQIEEATKRAGVVGTRKGENEANYQDFAAAIPGLEKVVDKLYFTADRATYTKTGQLKNAFVRQLGFDPGDEAAARVYYENLVRNEILPLLKPTFGAQFTVKEGEWLLATLGDVDLAPEEKKAALNARVDSWVNLANTMATRAGQPALQNIFQGQGSRVIVTNGKETLEIDEKDLQAAESDGFKRK